MKALITWSGALTGLMLIILGGFLPSSLLIPSSTLENSYMDLPSTWQVPALLICALVCGPSSGVIASIAYLTVGVFYVPIFHGGGSIEYLLAPSFGYLAGFAPGSWVSGTLARRPSMNSLIGMTLSGAAGLIVIHSCGILNIFVGSIFNRWPNPFLELIFSYSIAPFPTHLGLCAGVAIISIFFRSILLIE